MEIKGLLKYNLDDVKNIEILDDGSLRFNFDDFNIDTENTKTPWHDFFEVYFFDYIKYNKSKYTDLYQVYNSFYCDVVLSAVNNIVDFETIKNYKRFCKNTYFYSSGEYGKTDDLKDRTVLPEKMDEFRRLETLDKFLERCNDFVGEKDIIFNKVLEKLEAKYEGLKFNTILDIDEEIYSFKDRGLLFEYTLNQYPSKQKLLPGKYNIRINNEAIENSNRKFLNATIYDSILNNSIVKFTFLEVSKCSILLPIFLEYSEFQECMKTIDNANLDWEI